MYAGAREISEVSLGDEVYGIGVLVSYRDALVSERWNGDNELGGESHIYINSNVLINWSVIAIAII